MVNVFGRYWYRISSSFWFLPGLIVIAAAVLAVVMVEVDGRVGPDALAAWPRLFAAGTEGSRALLAAVAGSMITVAGTVFSITLVALSLASSQYSSRVLRNFMRDRANQVVLGSFVGIFAYCLVVLRTIHEQDSSTFVPALSVLFGMVLGFVGIAILVFFIHHIAAAVQASHIVAAVREETCGAIDRLFPESGADDDSQADPPAPVAGGGWTGFPADSTGYLQQIDFAGLRDLACRYQSTVRVHRPVGSFIVEGEPLASMHGAGDAAAGAAVARSLSIGRQRTLEQDIAFGIRQLVDVALKSLSSGINDSTTAIMCIDNLAAVLTRLGDRRLRFDDCHAAGVLRVEACHPRFDDLLNEAFDEIRDQAGDNLPVLQALARAFSRLGAFTGETRRRQALHRHALRLRESGRRTLRDPVNREALERMLDRVLADLDPA